MGWIGADLDGTLAKYPCPIMSIGEPIPKMVERIHQWLRKGTEVRIVTARVAACGVMNENGISDSDQFANEQREMIHEWVMKHIGVPLAITASKDFEMWELWDDRAVQVIFNTGERVGNQPTGKPQEMKCFACGVKIEKMNPTHLGSYLYCDTCYNTPIKNFKS